MDINICIIGFDSIHAKGDKLVFCFEYQPVSFGGMVGYTILIVYFFPYVFIKARSMHSVRCLNRFLAGHDKSYRFFFDFSIPNIDLRKNQECKKLKNPPGGSTLTGSESPVLIAELATKGFEAK